VKIVSESDVVAENCLKTIRWMSILEDKELNWVQYQICHGIEMRYSPNSIVWMSLNWSLELCSLISRNTEGRCSLLES
jgi:hypothetical protein